jgi:hypothetical protein
MPKLQEIGNSEANYFVPRKLRNMGLLKSIRSNRHPPNQISVTIPGRLRNPGKDRMLNFATAHGENMELTAIAPL